MHNIIFRYFHYHRNGCGVRHGVVWIRFQLLKQLTWYKTHLRGLTKCNDPLTKTPKLTRAKNIPEWTTYDKQVAELAQRLLKKDAEKKGSDNESVVDESMFVQIDSSNPKEQIIEKKEETKPKKDEL
jgi:hypothetical protein